uniref:Uncharacterized protein n=1 Tax=Opuntia streptacantha TaxID=393608 RepID=A0A7C9DHM0_OPUST
MICGRWGHPRRANHHSPSHVHKQVRHVKKSLQIHELLLITPRSHPAALIFPRLLRPPLLGLPHGGGRSCRPPNICWRRGGGDGVANHFLREVQYGFTAPKSKGGRIVRCGCHLGRRVGPEPNSGRLTRLPDLGNPLPSPAPDPPIDGVLSGGRGGGRRGGGRCDGGGWLRQGVFNCGWD